MVWHLAAIVCVFVMVAQDPYDGRLEANNRIELKTPQHK